MAAASPSPQKKSKFIKGRVVDTMRLNVLRDLPFSRNHVIKSAMISIRALEF